MKFGLMNNPANPVPAEVAAIAGLGFSFVDLTMEGPLGGDVDVARVRELLARHDLAPVALLATHGHADHIGGAGAIATRYSLTAYLHPDDDWLALDPAAQLDRPGRSAGRRRPRRGTRAA